MNQTENNTPAVEIREVAEIEEFRRCIDLQREAFGGPELEISPLRHFIVTKNCGGFTLGAFAKNRLVGFVHHLVALRGREIIGYSHMAAVAPDFQNAGIGARLKWAQREKALSQGVGFIKWTFDPMQSRNAHFNINRLGVAIRRYAENFYGTDYITMPIETGKKSGLDSDRLIAEWQLDSERVKAVKRGRTPENPGELCLTIEIPANWKYIVESDIKKACKEQLRVRGEFQNAFAKGLICAGFERGAEISRYLFYKNN